MTLIGKNKRRISIGITGVVLAAAGAGIWFRSVPDRVFTVEIDADDESLVAIGRTIYGQQCASCHGAKLEGQPDWRTRKPDGKLPAPPHDETGHTWHHADAQLFRLTRDGLKPPLAPDGYQSDMPAFGGVLTDEQIGAVLSFIKNSWSAPIRARQQRITDAVRKQSTLKEDEK
tara:strand:- start:2063 stop:2581 length:519 start_codon:yes stop_codon:yes gene_type:complete